VEALSITGPVMRPAPHEYAEGGPDLDGGGPPSVPLWRVSLKVTEIMPPEIVDDLRAQAMAAIACWLRRDQQGFDSVVGSAQEAQVLLPVCIGELITGLEKPVGPDEVARQVDEWLEVRRQRLAG
jgi:hypothetical protein